MMESRFRVRTIEHSTGEKSPILFSRTDGLPDLLANDWKMERRSVTHSHQTLRQELFAVAFFYDVARSRNWNLSKLFDSGNGLTSEMLATLREDCGRWHADVMCRPESMRLMASGIKKFRLDAIRKFCVWLLERVRERLSGSGRLAESVNVIHNIERHKDALKTTRVESGRRLGLKPSGINALQSLVDPTSPSNPFRNRFRLRNFLIVQLLLEYGLRRGELLGLRTSDVDYRAKHPAICVYRRPDEKIEKRTDVASKTRERRIAMNKGLARLVREYDKCDRKYLPRATGTPYLFLSAKGEPLGTDGFQNIFDVLRDRDPELAGISGHVLRHTWADAFKASVALSVKSGKVTENLAVLAFNYLGGWTQQSTQSTQYSQGFIESTANDLYLQMSAEQETQWQQLSQQLEESRSV